jgi:hypothetical protein
VVFLLSLAAAAAAAAAAVAAGMEGMYVCGGIVWERLAGRPTNQPEYRVEERRICTYMITTYLT